MPLSTAARMAAARWLARAHCSTCTAPLVHRFRAARCRSLRQARLPATTTVMDLNKFTEKSQAALMEAQNIATRNQHQAVDVEHLMLALLEQEGGLVPRLFERSKASSDLLKAKLEEELNRIPRVSGDTATGHGVYVTQRLNQLLVRGQ